MCFRASALNFSKLKLRAGERSFEHGFEKLSAEAQKHILQTANRNVAKFCHGREIELRYLLYLAGIARLGHDREEQK